MTLGVRSGGRKEIDRTSHRGSIDGYYLTLGACHMTMAQVALIQFGVDSSSVSMNFSSKDTIPAYSTSQSASQDSHGLEGK